MNSPASDPHDRRQSNPRQRHPEAEDHDGEPGGQRHETRQDMSGQPLVVPNCGWDHRDRQYGQQRDDYGLRSVPVTQLLQTAKAFQERLNG